MVDILTIAKERCSVKSSVSCYSTYCDILFKPTCLETEVIVQSSGDGTSLGSHGPVDVISEPIMPNGIDQETFGYRGCEAVRIFDVVCIIEKAAFYRIP